VEPGCTPRRLKEQVDMKYRERIETGISRWENERPFDMKKMIF